MSKIKKTIGAGVFCELYGDTARNRILEHFLANYETDFAAPDVAKEKNISKPQTYLIIEDLIKENILIKSRLVGKTQLYRLNMKNKITAFLLKNFEESLKLVFDDEKLKSHTSFGTKSFQLSAKHC